MTDVRRLASAAPPMPKRIAAQIRNGKTVYSSPYRAPAPAVTWRLKTPAHANARPIANTPASTARPLHGGRFHVRDVSSTGATSRSPLASPSHQVHHNPPNALHGCTPPRHRLTMPIVALIVVLITAPQTMRPRAWR